MHFKVYPLKKKKKKSDQVYFVLFQSQRRGICSINKMNMLLVDRKAGKKSF